jgi:hypothetical protein
VLRRDRSEWGKESVDGLGFLKVDSRQDAESLLGMLNAKLTKAESPKDKSSILTAITKMLHVLGRGPEMLEAAEQNHLLAGDSYSAGYMAEALYINGRTDEACGLYRQSHVLPHEDDEIDLNYAASLRFHADPDGWTESWKIVREKSFKTVQTLNLPEWRGQPVKKLHLFLEDGRGDVLLTLRYLESIKARGVKEIIACMPPDRYEANFTDLLRAQTWMVPIVWHPEKWADGSDRIEHAIGSGGIECCLDVKLADVPAPPLYTAPQSYIDKYKDLPKAKPLLGVVWAAGQLEFNWSDDGSMRTLKKSQLAKIVQEVDNVQWIKLQFNEPSPMPEIMAVPVETWLDTAGLISNLDAVVTVDTSAMHLGHAMGKPTFCVSSGATNWRLRNSDVFYPGMRVFQNPTFGFDDAIEALISGLREAFPERTATN